MIDHIKRWVILELGFLCSILITACLPSFTKDALPLWTFAEAYTFIVVAAITLPQFTIALSNSVIMRTLLSHTTIKLIFPFISYQVFLALVSLVVQLGKPACDNPTFISSLMIGLAVFDLFYIIWYITFLINKVTNPSLALNLYVSAIAVNVHTCKISSSDPSWLRFISQISEYSFDNYEKQAVLDAIRIIFEKIQKIESTKIFDRYPSDNHLYIIGKLIRSLEHTCTSNHHPANENVISIALELTNKIWSESINWTNKDFDFSIFPSIIGKLGRFSIFNHYRTSPDRSINILENIITKSYTDTVPRITPTVVGYQILSIGKSAIKYDRLKFAHDCFNSLLFFAGQNIRDNYIFLFFALDLAIRIHNKDADKKNYIKHQLESKEIESLIPSAINYGELNYQYETIKIKRFLGTNPPPEK